MSRVLSRVKPQLAATCAALLSLAVVSPPALAQTGSWTITPSANQGNFDNKLNALSALSSTAVWSVGSYNSGPYNTTPYLRTLIEFWNGSNWSIVSSPNPATKSGDYDSLQAVAAVSSNNVWAVGYTGNSNQLADRTLIEQWNGTAWNVVSSPNPYLSQDLYAISVVSANDIWAVGQFQTWSQNGSLTLHWDGTRWNNVSSPASVQLYGVAAVASNDVWAVGGYEIQHWNGTSWSMIPSPQPPYNTGYQLRAVAAVSVNNVWAVGYSYGGYYGYSYEPLIEHWDGSAWTLSPSANPTFSNTLTLSGVAALSATDVWAVGGQAGVSFIERWNGTQWLAVPSPNAGSVANPLLAAAALPSTGEAWAAGQSFSSSTSSYRTLVEHCQTC